MSLLFNQIKVVIINHLYGLVGKSMGLSYLWSCYAGSTNPGRGTIDGGVFHPTSQVLRFSPPNMPSIVNFKFI